MIFKNSRLFTKIYLSLIVIFFSSCKENYSLVNNPPNGLEYESKIFNINLDDSESYRPSNYNSGNSQLLYLGKVEEHNANDTESNILLRINKDLILQSDVCLSDNISEYNFSNVELILRMKTNIEFRLHFYGAGIQYSSYLISSSQNFIPTL